IRYFHVTGVQTCALPIYARALAWRLASANGNWKAIVCITRGGLVPAAVIARELGIRLIETVCVASYHDYNSQGELQVLKEIHPRSEERRVGKSVPRG